MGDKTNPPPQGISHNQAESSAENALIRKIEQEVEKSAPGALKKISNRERSVLLQASARVSATIVARSGPLPDPEDLARYSQIIPDGADRIMRMAESQSAHRIAIESHVIRCQQKQSGRGQFFGLGIAIFGISAGVYAAMQGHDVVGGVIGGTTVVSLAVAFITGKTMQQKDLLAKRPQ